MLRRIALGVMIVSLLWIGGRAILRALESDETKIRRAVSAACEGFSETRMNPILEVLAQEFRDETSGFQRDDLRAALASVFFSAKDPKTRGFPYRLELDADGFAVTVAAGDPNSAHARFTATIHDVSNGGDRIAWRFRVDGQLIEREDQWLLVHTVHESLDGSWRLTAR